VTWTYKMKALDPFGTIVLRIHRAKIAPPRLEQENGAQQRPAGGLRNIEQLDEGRIPGDQPAMPVEYTEPLAHVFEGALQQRALLPEFLLAVTLVGERAVLAVEGARQQPSQTAGGQHQDADADQKRDPDRRRHVVEDFFFRTAPDRRQRNRAI